VRSRSTPRRSSTRSAAGGEPAAPTPEWCLNTRRDAPT
jgi:hypothetical protein